MFQIEFNTAFDAAVDKLSDVGLPPIGVNSELVNDDGTVARGPQVVDFASKHGLKLLSVAYLITYRQHKETLIELGSSFDIETPFGKARAHTYSLPWDPKQRLAFVFGEIRDGVDIPVCLHPENTDDLFGKLKPVDFYMQKICRTRMRRHHLPAVPLASAITTTAASAPGGARLMRKPRRTTRMAGNRQGTQIS